MRQLVITIDDYAQFVYLISDGKVGWYKMWIDISDPQCLDKLFDNIVKNIHEKSGTIVAVFVETKGGIWT